MASSGYMTEEDTESIWNASFATARFDKINVRIGELLNFWVRKDKDSQTDITDTKITPILEQLSEEVLIELLTAANAIAPSAPIPYIMSNISSVFAGVVNRNWRIIKRLRTQQEDSMDIGYSNQLTLPSHSD